MQKPSAEFSYSIEEYQACRATGARSLTGNERSFGGFKNHLDESNDRTTKRKSQNHDHIILSAVQCIIQNMIACEDSSQQQLHYLQSEHLTNILIPRGFPWLWG